MTHPPPEHIWYLPTHSVENPNKPAKVRCVAKAASMFKGTSLNDNLLTGQDFAKHVLGVLADIEDMFMQIAIQPEDQSALRFLWLEDDLVRQYQYTTRLTIGANFFIVLLVVPFAPSGNVPLTIATSSRTYMLVHSKIST